MSHKYLKEEGINAEQQRIIYTETPFTSQTYNNVVIITNQHPLVTGVSLVGEFLK